MTRTTHTVTIVSDMLGSTRLIGRRPADDSSHRALRAGRAGWDAAGSGPLVLWTLLLGLGVLAACSGPDGSPAGATVAQAGHQHAGEPESHQGHANGDGHAHDHGAEGSDLDRPVPELMAAGCEHDVPAHACAECRYEVGVARAGDELFDAEQGGVLRSLEVGRGSVVALREVPGEVALDGNRSVTITPLAEGVVAAVGVDLGERVRSGQPLLELECPAFRQAVADLDRAGTALAAAEAALAREEELFARRVCPEKDLLAARADLAAARSARRSAAARLLAFGLGEAEAERLAAGSDPGHLELRSPIDGEVVERRVARGSRVAPGDELLLVADTSHVWVMAELYEADLAAVLGAGDGGRVAAEVEVRAWPGRRFQGRVERLTGTLDPTTRTARARVVVDNAGGLLRPGMFATVRLLLPGRDGAIMVPREAVLEDAGRSFAFVHVEGPYWMRRPVRTGTVVADRIEVLDGLRLGDRIVTTGAFLLKSDVLRSKMGAGCAD